MPFLIFLQQIAAAGATKDDQEFEQDFEENRVLSLIQMDGSQTVVAVGKSVQVGKCFLSPPDK
jgi:hypothetical protein